jgi:hypothetical protein
LTNFEEEIVHNHFDDNDEGFSVKREGALNKSLDAGYVGYNPEITGFLDTDEVLQDLEEMDQLEESSVENGLR